MDKNTRKLLGLTEESLTFEENWLSSKKIGNSTAHIIQGRLVSSQTHCLNCGMKNIGSVVRNGTYKTTTQLPALNRQLTYIELKRERYLCRACQSTFSAPCPLTDDYCHISKQLKYHIAFDLKENRSRSSIAKYHNVSDNTVVRVMKDFTHACKPNFNHLPTVLSVDEFKSTNSCHNQMSFICVDAETKQIIDILSDRRLHKITAYFMKYSRKARLAVKFIVMDMNASYGELLKTVFPNAQIIIDRFHIIQPINRSFNQLRIKEMNLLKRHDSTEAKQYRRLKRYWKLLLKDSADLDFKNFNYHFIFKKVLTETEVIDELLTYRTKIKIAYHYIQDLKYAFNSRDFAIFLYLTN